MNEFILVLLEWRRNKLKEELKRLKEETSIKPHSHSVAPDYEAIANIKNDLAKLNSAIHLLEQTKYKKKKHPLFCRHTNVSFHRFVYGDEVYVYNTRKLHKCDDCDKIIIYPEDRF
jgi:hypothetical protein